MSTIKLRYEVIKRFEYCIDLLWKFLKIYLEEVHKINVEVSSPKAILKLALAAKAVSNEEHDILVKSVLDRNLTSHTYNEETAEAIEQHIPLYYHTMITIIDRLENSMQ